MRAGIGAAAALLMALVGCGAGGGPQVDAASVVPVRPAPSPYGVAPSPAGTPGAAAGSVHASGARGYDASFPQCARGRRPAGAAFSILGVNGGRAFTANRCLGALWRGAPRPRSLYLNSGYRAANRGRITPGCATLAQRLDAGATRREAYALGCAAAVHARRQVRAEGVGAPAMWWIDVELANSWDDHDVNLNRYSLQGQIDQLDATGAPVGIYSTPRDWTAFPRRMGAGRRRRRLDRGRRRPPGVRRHRLHRRSGLARAGRRSMAGAVRLRLRPGVLSALSRRRTTRPGSPPAPSSPA